MREGIERREASIKHRCDAADDEDPSGSVGFI
jgi:hypothetical protein